MWAEEKHITALNTFFDHHLYSTLKNLITPDQKHGQQFSVLPEHIQQQQYYTLMLSNFKCLINMRLGFQRWPQSMTTHKCALCEKPILTYYLHQCKRVYQVKRLDNELRIIFLFLIIFNIINQTACTFLQHKDLSVFATLVCTSSFT